jgi:hypothetical protein
VPDLPVSTVDAARTVRDSALSSVATLRRPVLLMFVPITPPPAVQTTVWAGLLSSLTTFDSRDYALILLLIREVVV